MTLPHPRTYANLCVSLVFVAFQPRSPPLPSSVGKAENVAAAQEVLMMRAQANGAAQLGKYEGGASGGAAGDSLHQANYSY